MSDQQTIAGPPADPYDRSVTTHSGRKYLRRITDADGLHGCDVDVYCVIRAYKVICPAIQHALKKLLCPGRRDKGAAVQDLREAIDALYRAYQFAKQDEREEREALEELKKTASGGELGRLADGTLVVKYGFQAVMAEAPVVSPGSPDDMVKKTESDGTAYACTGCFGCGIPIKVPVSPRPEKPRCFRCVAPYSGEKWYVDVGDAQSDLILPKECTDPKEHD